MNSIESNILVEEYFAQIKDKSFPCVAAKAAAANGEIRCFAATHMACPAEDTSILQFLYQFVDDFRKSSHSFQSAVVLFKGPEIHSEEMFDELLWQRLQSLADLDAANYPYDKRVSAHPSSAKFSFSLKEEAFYVIGLHPLSSRKARTFHHPALVFNPHDQFVQLRKSGKYDAMRRSVRKRDLLYSGTINPMLADFGESSEVSQYSGRQYPKDWKCPLSIHHGKTNRDPTS